jgi:hypothetical protein
MGIAQRRGGRSSAGSAARAKRREFFGLWFFLGAGTEKYGVGIQKQKSRRSHQTRSSRRPRRRRRFLRELRVLDLLDCDCCAQIFVTEDTEEAPRSQRERSLALLCDLGVPSVTSVTSIVFGCGGAALGISAISAAAFTDLSGRPDFALAEPPGRLSRLS